MDLTRALVRSDLRRRWRSWSAVTLLIAVIAGVSMAAVAGWLRTNSAMERFFEYHRAANAYAEGFFENEEIEAIPGVEAALGGDYFLLVPAGDVDGGPPDRGRRGSARSGGRDGSGRRRGDGGAVRPPAR